MEECIKCKTKDEELKILQTAIKGMILSLLTHGQRIDVKFHIDYLHGALRQTEKLDEQK